MRRGLTAESILIITLEALYVVYVSFKDETIAAMTRLDLGMLHQAEIGLLPSAEIKGLGLHAKAVVASADNDGSRANGKFPVLRMTFKVGEACCLVFPWGS